MLNWYRLDFRPLFCPGSGGHQHHLGSDHPELPGVPALRIHPVHHQLLVSADLRRLHLGHLLAKNQRGRGILGTHDWPYHRPYQVIKHSWLGCFGLQGLLGLGRAESTFGKWLSFPIKQQPFQLSCLVVKIPRISENSYCQHKAVALRSHQF